VRFRLEEVDNLINGPIWATESSDLDVTVLNWFSGMSVPEHVNTEVDVALFVLFGSGFLEIDKDRHLLRAGDLYVIPKGSSRHIVAGEEGLRYVNVHRRRRRLMPT